MPSPFTRKSLGTMSLGKNMRYLSFMSNSIVDETHLQAPIKLCSSLGFCSTSCEQAFLGVEKCYWVIRERFWF